MKMKRKKATEMRSGLPKLLSVCVALALGGASTGALAHGGGAIGVDRLSAGQTVGFGRDKVKTFSRNQVGRSVDRGDRLSAGSCWQYRHVATRWKRVNVCWSAHR